MLNALSSKAAEHGLLVLLACHRIRVQYPGPSLHSEWPGDWDGLWYERHEWPESRILANWGRLANSGLCSQWNVVAADLMNEPHSGGWGRGGASRDWRLGAQRLGEGVLGHCKR